MPEALCSGFDTLAVAIGVFHDTVVDFSVIGEIHFDLLTGGDQVYDVGRRELVSDHDHELVLRQDLNEGRDGGLKLLKAREAEFTLCLWDCRSFLGTF